MNREPDRDSETTEPPADEPPGRVEFDARGNSVWRWARGVLDSTSVLLKRLENKDLALEPTQKVPVMGGGGAALPAGCALLLRMGTRIACALADQRIGSDLRRGIGPPRDPDLRQLHLRLTGGCYGDHGPEARRC